jgi:hypothetical protein
MRDLLDLFIHAILIKIFIPLTHILQDTGINNSEKKMSRAGICFTLFSWIFYISGYRPVKL